MALHIASISYRMSGIVSLPPESTQALAKLAQRTKEPAMHLQDGQVWLGDSDESVQVKRVMLKEAAGR